MADRITPTRRSANMARIRGRDTKPELIVRKLLHGEGFRYRLHRRDLPGKPDLTFAQRRKVIFVHGCFWHQHQAEGCAAGHKPKSNTDYWHAKLARNVARDEASLEQLAVMGWQTMVVWECETRDPAALASKLRLFLDEADRLRVPPS